MKRPEQHLTDSRGDALLRTVFAPSGWVVNGVEKDYGWDYDIEVFKDGESTGFSFKVQLKSSTVSEYSADRTFVSQELTIDQAEYLAVQQIAPTVLMHADVVTNQLYWNTVQLDSSISQTIAAKKVSSTTVRIQTKNLLPQTTNQLLASLMETQKILAAKTLLLSSSVEFVDLMRRQQVLDNDDVIKALQEKAHRLQLYRAHDLFRAGNSAEARSRAESLLNGTDVEIGLRFSSVLQLERIDYSALAKSAPVQLDLAKLTLRTGNDLLAMVRKGPPELKFYALIAKTAGELSVLITQHVGLGMNWKANEKHGHPLWRLHLTQELNNNLVRIGQKYRQCLRLVRYASQSTHRSVLPTALLRIAREVPHLTAILNGTGIDGIAAQYRQSAFEIFKLAAALAEEAENLDDYVEAVTLALLIEQGETGKVQDWARKMIDRITDVDYRARADWFYDRWLRRKQGEDVEGDTHSTLQQIFKNMAFSLGLDPANPELKRLFEEEMKDSDPSRVLKNCAHLFVSLGPKPPMIANLGLRHAGPKFVHCTRHNYHVYGKDLDSAFSEFETSYCSKCPDKTAREQGWTYSPQWQLEENERQLEFMAKFHRKLPL